MTLNEFMLICSTLKEFLVLCRKSFLEFAVVVASVVISNLSSAFAS